MKFGFLIDSKEFTCEDFRIKKSDRFEETIESFYLTTNVSNGWIYGPEKELTKSLQEKKQFKLRGPIICDSFYTMTPTHEMISKIDDVDYLRFLILGYGFLQGLYLTPEGYSCINRVPYEPGKLNGLLLIGDDHVNGMEHINRFYWSSNKLQRDQIFAAIHWFLVGQTYKHLWEKFEANYKVLDGIYKLSELKASSHAQRPVILAEEYGISLPDWAVMNDKTSRVSKERNQLFHEAKFGGVPIGYGYPEDNYYLEFTSFNTKLIAASLGINTPYLKATPNDRNMWGWNIEP